MEVKTIKKVGVILRPSTPELKNDFFKLEKIFNLHDIEVTLESVSGGMIGAIGMDFNLLCENSDMLVTLGGDGTLISTVRRSFEFDIPIFGVYAGTLGFLADVQLDELNDFVGKIKSGDYRVDERSILEVTFKQNTKEMKRYAFNDVVVTRPCVSNMIHVETLVDSKAFNTYYGDGVIVATPTGSTAYNLSAGGPVLFPLTNVFTLTPICPHSLTQRAVVFPGEFSIEMKTPRDKALVIIDGQNQYELNPSESLHINLAKKRVKLIHRSEFNYFEVLKEKLGWGK